MSKNVCVNLIMLTLKYLISTILHTNLNVTIHFKWTNLFVYGYNLVHSNRWQIYVIFDSSNSKNEKRINCAPIDYMVHNFLNVSKINDYENVTYLNVAR
jgi:hypothetical protein